MAKDRGRKKGYSRAENTREEKKASSAKCLLTFSFKDFDKTQPTNNVQNFTTWANDGLLDPLLERIKDLSKLTRDEAVNQKQIKIYGDFPPKDKTDFSPPSYVDKNVAWSVIKAIGGQKGVAAGYIVESTFYIVFFDKEHKFWISKKKHT